MERVTLVAVVLGALMVGCSSNDDRPPGPCENVAPDAREACLTEHYFRGYEAQTLPACSGFTPTTEKIGGKREITFFAGPTISDEAVRIEGRFLQRFYEPYELSFFTRQAIGSAGMTYALDGTTEELRAIPDQLGVPSTGQLTDEQKKRVEKAVGDVLFRNLRVFVQSRSSPPKPLIDVVILSNIASPDVAAQFVGGVIGGLGLSPALFRDIAAGDPNSNLFELIGIEGDFTPVLFVGHDDVTKLAKAPDVIVAHELGHAMGLQHTTAFGDLMTQYGASQACLPGLTDREVEMLKRSAALLDPTEAWHRLFALRDSIIASIIAHRLRRASE